MITAILVCLVGGVLYRLRGGGWVALGSTTACRIIWAAAMVAIYALVAYPSHWPWYAVYLPFAAYLSMLVPHAFAQNMGSWPKPQKEWPAFFLPTATDEQWAALPLWARVAYDFGGMAGVGFCRGIVVFGIYLAILLPVGISAFLAAMPYLGLAMGVITILQPTAYLLGKFMPFTVTQSLHAHSSEWGEFFTGAAWALALACL